MLHWGAEVISSLLQLYPGGPARQLEERSSPWLRPHRTPPPRLWLASSYSFSSRLFSRRTPLSQRPRPHPRWTPWPIWSAQRKNTQRFPSEVSDHLQPHLLHQSVLYSQCCFYMDTFCWDNAVCGFCKISIFIQLPGNLISCFFFCDSLFSNFRFITVSFFNKRIWNKGNMKAVKCQAAAADLFRVKKREKTPRFTLVSAPPLFRHSGYFFFRWGTLCSEQSCWSPSYCTAVNNLYWLISNVHMGAKKGRSSWNRLSYSSCTSPKGGVRGAYHPWGKAVDVEM